MQHDCGKCDKAVRGKSKALLCDLCKKWFHCNTKCGKNHEYSYKCIKEKMRVTVISFGTVKTVPT